MEPQILTIIILGAVVLFLVIFIIILNNRISKLTRGNKGSSLESIIRENNRLVTASLEKLESHNNEINTIKENAMETIQNIGVIRFNPFKETGGNQSFAVALTDKRNNGVVISSLYARERLNVFAKPVINGGSEYTLTEEEKEAIKQSQK